MLLIDNASSHPESFVDCFSHVKIVFLPKNTTSKLQPLDAGIIKNFKVFYRKQLLQHVLARIKPGSKASDVITSVDLLKSVEWVMDPWRKVKKERLKIQNSQINTRNSHPEVFCEKKRCSKKFCKMDTFFLNKGFLF